MERQISTEPGVNTALALETSARSSGSVRLKQLPLITHATKCFLNESA